jgi:hypothetical protein
MNQRRHFNSIASVLAVMIFTAGASADKMVRGPNSDNASPPVFHTNQDGPWGSHTPGTPIDILAQNNAPKSDDTPNLIDLVVQAGFVVPLERRPNRWPPAVMPAADMLAVASPPHPPVGMNPVPAPGALLLLGVAGAARRRKRRESA